VKIIFSTPSGYRKASLILRVYSTVTAREVSQQMQPTRRARKRGEEEEEEEEARAAMVGSLAGVHR
jgi:hypothetical protein